MAAIGENMREKKSETTNPLYWIFAYNMYMYVYVNRFLISFQYNNQYGQQKGIWIFD